MDITAILAALLFWTGNLLKLINLGRENAPRVTWEQMTNMDGETIMKEWEFRASNKSQVLATGIITSLAWFAFCFPMLQLTYVLSQNRGVGSSRSVWLHAGIVILTLGGCFLEWIANFMFFGSYLACDFMASHFNLQNWITTSDGSDDMIGIRALETAYFAIRGMVFWVDAFEWCALSFIMIFIFVSIKRYQRIHPEVFGSWWNALGLFIGLLSMLDFVTEVLRSVNFKLFSVIAFWYGSANRLILIPAWLIVLAWRLPYALMTLEQKNLNDGIGGTINNNIEQSPQRRSQPTEVATGNMENIAL